MSTRPESHLTCELIQTRSRCNRFDTLKALNCWGCNLKDITMLKELPSLRILILTSNSIVDLSPISQCLKLRELYLRNNKIEDLHELGKLKQLTNLRSIWISENPCTTTPTVNYAEKVFSILPNIKYLDGQPIETYLEQSKGEERLENSNLFKAVSILIHEMSGDELIELQKRISLLLS
eukprot:TRINITY_DN13932_c0_g1_i1.p1 TRINITY_DN13932_c0_g1~~TRINITY_DN13932_c0_g1_i1.p1  ORF type:complete len:186 (-),score=21.19 TRINITY_DN13932_c0_g1_i1:125-661(-)